MKKKLAFISEHASPLATLGGTDSGGQNVYVAELPKQLAKLGFEIDIYTRKENVEDPVVVNWLPGIRVIHIQAGPEDIVPKEKLLSLMGEFTDNMASFIRRHHLHYELIHANFFMSGLVAARLKKTLSIPFVITFHALGLVRKMHQKEMDHFPPERMEIERELMQQADRIIAECPQDKQDMITLYNAPEEKISIIPCGFSDAEFFPMDKRYARRILNFSPDEKIILQLGRMVPRKGIDNVIRAFGRLKNLSHPTRLVIVGGEKDKPDATTCPELRRLLDIVHSHAPDSNVTFTGRRQRKTLKYFYAAADIFITTPWYEPFGITPLEAMACGTPVIGSNVGGIKYTVKDGETGFLVPPHDPESLAEKMHTLIKNEPVLNMMRKNCLERVRRYFTWNEVARSCRKVYESLVSVTDSKHNFGHENHLLPTEAAGIFLRETA